MRFYQILFIVITIASLPLFALKLDYIQTPEDIKEAIEEIDTTKPYNLTIWNFSSEISPADLSPQKRLEILNEVLAGISEEARTNLKELDLSYIGLTTPPTLPKLDNLKKLEMHDNRLTVAPDVSNFKNLIELNLNRNRLSNPPDVSGLSNLEVLTLHNNKLSTAPQVIGLTNLQELDLSRNKLTIPPQIDASLRKLQYIDLRENDLKEPLHIPASLRDIEIDGVSKKNIRYEK